VHHSCAEKAAAYSLKDFNCSLGSEPAAVAVAAQQFE
jgi:hypothetical protein